MPSEVPPTPADAAATPIEVAGSSESGCDSPPVPFTAVTPAAAAAPVATRSISVDTGAKKGALTSAKVPSKPCRAVVAEPDDDLPLVELGRGKGGAFR